MSARWDNPPPFAWEDKTGLTLSPDEPSKLFRGLAYALTIQLVVLVVVAGVVVLVLLAGRAVAAPQPLPAIYAQCVLNGHASDICLGA